MPEENNQNKLSQVVFSWPCPEYVKYPKNIRWYLISLLVLALAIWWTIHDSNYLFLIFLVLFYLIVIMYESREPRMIDVFITADGIKFGRNFYEYKLIEDFFIIYQEAGMKNLYLDFKNPLRGRLVVPVDGQDAVAIREFLLGYLKEDLEREAEPLSERFRRWLKI